MTEPATSASSFGSPIADRIAAWAQDHPEETEYCLNDEFEARELLVTIAAHIKILARDVQGEDRRLMKRYRSDMIRATVRGEAIDYVRRLNEGEPLEFLGLKITTPEKVLQ